MNQQVKGVELRLIWKAWSMSDNRWDLLDPVIDKALDLRHVLESSKRKAEMD